MKTINYTELESLLTKCVIDNYEHEATHNHDNEVYFECDYHRFAIYGTITVATEEFVRMDNSNGSEDVYVIEVDRVVQLDENEDEHLLRLDDSQLTHIGDDIKVLINEH